MSLTGNNGLLGSSAHGTNQPAYSIDQSLRFNDGDTAYLSRTPSASNRKTWTYSFWFKRSGIDLADHGSVLNVHAGNNDNDFISLEFVKSGSASEDAFRVSFWNDSIVTSQVFRDPSSWGHLIIAFDTTQSTASNRVKFYYNGEQITSFSNANYPSQDANTAVNAASAHVIGEYTGGDDHYDGYLAEVNFIDGTALTPASFGETNSDTNQWQAIKYAGSYGTNGFHLKFQDSSALGDDSSGNTNDFTATNLAATDQVIDSPSNNFCTLNPVDAFNSMTATEGSLRANTNSGSDPKINATFQIPQSGKWYWEFVDQHGLSIMVGVIDQTNSGNIYGNNNSAIYSSGLGTKYNFSSVSSYGASWTTGDIIGVAINRDDNEITFYKNNSSQGTFTIGGTADQRARLIPVIGTGTGGTGGGTFNFGQDSSFHGTKTAQGNGGVGEDFYYTPPTGFKALNTDNLDDPAIALPTAHFNTVLYTGDASNPKTVSGVGFSADMVWLKSRGISQRHNIYDTVRGIPKSGSTDVPRISPDDATAESDTTDELRTVTSDGFTVDTSRNGSGNTYVAWNWKGNDTPTKTFAVTVTNPGSGNRYTLDGKVSGTNAMPITIEEGGTYTFDQSDNTNSGHPLRFSTTSNGTWGGGSEYTTGVTTNGTPGNAGAYTRITVAATAPTLYYYCTNHSGMGAAITTPGSGGGVSDLSGTIASVVNANTTAGFSIATYTGNGTSPSTIGHGLSVAPEMVMVKNRTTAGENWVVSVGNATGTNGDFLILNTDSAVIAGTSQFPSQPGSSTFAVTDAANVNTNTSNYIAYCFHSVDGYSKVGSYTGNGSTDGTFVYTGFRPTFVMLKDTSAVEDWVIHDTTRAPYNQSQKVLYPNTNGAEEDSSNRAIDIVSNGFKARNNGGRTNRNGDTYIYYVVGYPFKTSNAR